MYHITTETATQNGEFTDGDELNAIPPTDLNALWFNMIQRELLNVLAGVGVTPDASNFSQVWESLEKIGLKIYTSNYSVVDLSAFSGSCVIFHSASNFSFSGVLEPGSLVVVVPIWEDDSEEIKVVYNSNEITIEKFNILLGLVFLNNNVNSLYSIKIPIKRPSDDYVVSNIESQNIVYTNLICRNVETFDGSMDEEIGTYDFNVLQLKEKWEIGQVKKIAYVGNAESIRVPVHTSSTNVIQVEFKPYTYKEFICTGYYEFSRDYALFLVNE